MKKILYLTAGVIAIFLICALYGQRSKSADKIQNLKPLTVGDKVPDVVFDKMLNHTSSTGKLSDFKGKAIIIDMWFKECGSCIAGMPHLDSLQTEFKNDLQILLVTWQPKTDIQAFWKKRHQIKNLKFTQAVEDTIMRQLFPARGYPHQIWINKEGYVAAITGGGSTTRDNVAKLVQGRALDLNLKQDELDWNVRHSVEPMIKYYYDRNKVNILFYSYFSKYRPEFTAGSEIKVDKKDKLVRVNFRNADFLRLYHFAYSGANNVPVHAPTRMIREDSKPIATQADYKGMSNVFCYDLIYKDTVSTTLGNYMITDLDRFFNVQSHEELREMDCYVLRPTGINERYKEALKQEEESYIINKELKKGEALVLNKGFVPYLEMEFMHYVDKPLLWDFGEEIKKVSNLFKRTNLISFKVTWNLENLPAMNKELAEYGLEITLEKRLRKVIVLRNK